MVTHQSRAIFVATLNAVLRHLELVRATLHCKDDDPESCAREIASVLFQKYGKVRVGLIGLNPAIAEQLVDTFEPSHVHITDLNSEDIGSKRFGVEIWDGDDRTDDLVAISDVVLVTGTTILNGTFDRIWKRIRGRKKGLSSIRGHGCRRERTARIAEDLPVWPGPVVEMKMESAFS